LVHGFIRVRVGTWINSIFNAAIFPVMAGHYIVTSFDLGRMGHHEIYAEVLVLLLLLLRMFR
jgi:hypothetical protein